MKTDAKEKKEKKEIKNNNARFVIRNGKTFFVERNGAYMSAELLDDMMLSLQLFAKFKDYAESYAFTRCDFKNYYEKDMKLKRTTKSKKV